MLNKTWSPRRAVVAQWESLPQSVVAPLHVDHKVACEAVTAARNQCKRIVVSSVCRSFPTGDTPVALFPSCPCGLL